jgi:gliding motility-associated-like protein
LIGTPTGGTFKINGNVATQFDANMLGVGTHTITYELAGCTITASKTTIVNALPTVSITGLQASYCSDVTAITLAGLGSPAGGTFRVNGVVATQFNPNTAGAGNYTIQYTFTNAQGCTKSTTQDVLVIASPTPTFTNLQATYCISQASFALQASPTGGTFKINGNDAPQFNPQMLGIGNHVVTYSFTNAQGCSKTISQNVEIAPLPTVSILGLADIYCLGNLFLAPTASPNGGQFFINGNPMPLFNINTFGVGTHTLSYTFTDTKGCSATDTKTFQIFDTPTVEFVGLNSSYCASQASFALQASPIGGNFKINGVDATNFDVQALGAGKHIVQYTFAPPQGCGKTIEQEVEVFPVPTLAFVNLPTEYCSQGNITVLEATPTGGTFFLNGAVSSVFNPADYAIGDIVTVRYDFTSINGCSNSITQQVRMVFSSSFEEDAFDIETCPITAGTPLEALTEQEETDLRNANGNLTYLWSNGATTRTIYLRSENDGGQYKVAVKNVIGCPLRAYTFNVTIKCNTQFFVPSAFTPNGDGKNDQWEILGDDFTKLDLRVYNRWGETVFITSSKEKRWDGTVGGKPAPAGVYAWSVSYENPLKKGVVEKKQGQVTILR